MALAEFEAASYITAHTLRLPAFPGRGPMSTSSSPRTVVTARIASQHVAELRRRAEANDTTVSRLVARAVADQLERRDHAAPDKEQR